jgi:hypothetical protein
MNHTERCDRLDLFIAENRLIRKDWGYTDSKGRELACLLAALAPEVGLGEDGEATKCPAEVMPLWLAYLTPWIDDAGGENQWPTVIRRYASLARRWEKLTAEDWQRLEYKVRSTILREIANSPGMKEPLRSRVLEAIAVFELASSGPEVMDLTFGRGWDFNSESGRIAGYDRVYRDCILVGDSGTVCSAASKAELWCFNGEADGLIDAILTTLEKAIYAS